MPDRRIHSVAAISTGRAALHREHREGSSWPQMWWVLTSTSWIEVPIHCFVIQHRDGLVLFDTGLDPAISSDPTYIDSAIGRFLLKRIFKLHIGPQDSLAQQLRNLGLEPRDVAKAVISHLHFDHIGGIADIPQAELIVHADEWAQLSKPHPERQWILREHIEIPGARWRPVRFAPSDDPLLSPFGDAYDVMGDGALVMLPTPGHSPGSTSLLVRDAGMQPLLLIGDLAYDAGLLLNDQVPGTGDKLQLRDSYENVRTLKAQLPDLVIVPSHDPVAAGALGGA